MLNFKFEPFKPRDIFESKDFSNYRLSKFIRYFSPSKLINVKILILENAQSEHLGNLGSSKCVKTSQNTNQSIWKLFKLVFQLSLHDC